MTLRRFCSLLLSLSVVSLAACGGGGGTKLVAIDQTNAEEVTSSALSASEFVMQMADFVDGLVDIIEIGDSGPFPCDSGEGTVTINDVAPQGVISAGDSVSIRFINCVVNLGGDDVTLNGLITFQITSASFPGGGAYDILLKATFSNFLLSAFGTTIRVNGGFNLRLETPDGNVFTTTTSGSSLEASIQVGATVIKNVVSSFTYTEVFDTITGDYSITGSGRVFDGSLGRSFDTEVTVPLEGTDPDDPDSGQLLSTGANNSSVLLFVLDNVNVELRVDEDGDGIVDVTIPTTWDALFG